MSETKCPKCKRMVTLIDGKIVTHGPAKNGDFVCPGSGDKGMIKAAQHIKVK